MPSPRGNAQYIAPTNRYFVTVLRDEDWSRFRSTSCDNLRRVFWYECNCNLKSRTLWSSVSQLPLPNNWSGRYCYPQLKANFFPPKDTVSYRIVSSQFLIPTPTAQNSSCTNHLCAQPTCTFRIIAVKVKVKCPRYRPGCGPEGG